MKSTRELLEQYNSMTDKPLASWKGKKADLEARIAKLSSVAKVDPLEAYKQLSGKDPGNLMSVAEWARALGKDPKVCRAKLRAAGVKDFKRIARNSAEWKIINDIRSRT